jgi:hypothetical protein
MTRPEEEPMVKVHVLEHQFEADHILDALTKAGITAWIKEYRDTAYNGIYVARKGWGGVWVPRSKKEAAEAIVAEVLRAFES